MEKSNEAKFKVGDIVSDMFHPNGGLVVERVYWSRDYGTYLYILDNVPKLDFYGILEESFIKFESHDNHIEEVFNKWNKEDK